jgi:FkbM family methyltransferase
MRNTLDDLLSEPVAVAKEREAVTFEKLVGGKPLVLFGADGLGRRTLAGLRAHGIEPLAFCDNNAALWGKTVEGVPVLSLAQAAAQYGSAAAFVITIWGGRPTDKMTDREALLRAAGCSTVLHWGTLYWRYPELFPHYSANAAHRILERKDAVRTCADLWADDESRREYLAQVRWRLDFDFAGLPDPVPGPMYFRDELFAPRDDEVFVDCGAYDGDTVCSFMEHIGWRFKKIYAFEPDPVNFQKLALADNIVAKQAAVGRTNGVVAFSAEASESSAAGKGESQVERVTLDSYLAGEHPTLIKMDIEGFEPEALAGAKEIIARHSPVLAICVYHAQEHLWEIPLQIHSYNPGYRFYLRPARVRRLGFSLLRNSYQQVRPPSIVSTAPVI